MLANHLALRSYPTECCSHTHDFSQLVLPLAGSMALEVGQYSGVVNEHKAVYIAPNERHCFAGSQENLFLVIDIKEKNHQGFAPHIFDISPSTKKLLQFTHHYLCYNERDFFTDSLINQLLCHFTVKAGLPELDRVVLNARNWIDGHFAQPVDVCLVARHCHLSISQLQRRFKQTMGCGLAEYWRTKKLQQAKYLLAAGNRSIDAIAFAVGYENLSAFSRRFSQVFGESPSQWRRKAFAAHNMRETDN